nr:hypothetical protein [Sphingomonas sp. Y57]
MKKIHLHTADRRITPAGTVRAEAGEDLIVGEEISAERAQELVDRGGAIVVDPLDHDGNGRKGGSKGRSSKDEKPVPTVELEPRELGEGEMLQDASADLGLVGEPISVDQLQASE